MNPQCHELPSDYKMKGLWCFLFLSNCSPNSIASKDMGKPNSNSILKHVG